MRVLATAAALGMETVAVYSDADSAAPHVRMADRAVRLGPAPARESYLRGDAVLEAALASGAGAMHPGYGFLAEDPGFARAVEASGLVFVGPTPEQLELFGVKHTARAAAAAAGVPLVPGSGLLAGLEEALGEAERIGYPVMVKATGGGGGIGIAPCERPGRPRRGVRASDAPRRHELRKRRGVPGAAHRHGAPHRGTGTRGRRGRRGRSRRPGLQPAAAQPEGRRGGPGPEPAARGAGRPAPHLREQLCASVSYRSAGTVEFVYDVERAEAMFLEVNTRLQVEHPVTEQVYGVDLVALHAPHRGPRP